MPRLVEKRKKLNVNQKLDGQYSSEIVMGSRILIITNKVDVLEMLTMSYEKVVKTLVKQTPAKLDWKIQSDTSSEANRKMIKKLECVVGGGGGEGLHRINRFVVILGKTFKIWYTSEWSFEKLGKQKNSHGDKSGNKTANWMVAKY